MVGGMTLPRIPFIDPKLSSCEIFEALPARCSKACRSSAFKLHELKASVAKKEIVATQVKTARTNRIAHLLPEPRATVGIPLRGFRRHFLTRIAARSLLKSAERWR